MPFPIDWDEFVKDVKAPFGDHPQSVGLADFHLANLKAAMEGLLVLGHRVGVGFVPAPAPIEWPKMMYRSSGIGPGNTMEVSSHDAQRAALHEGWRLHPTAEGEPEPMPQAVAEPPSENKVDGSVAVHWPAPVPASGQGQMTKPAGEPAHPENEPEAHEPMATSPIKGINEDHE